MCIIIDACVLGEFFGECPSEASRPIRKWIEENEGRMVSGGKLSEELMVSNAATSQIVTWWRSGHALLYKKEAVNAEEKAVQSAGICKSNDAHIIALARVSGARVLFSRDKAGLHEDFRNGQLVNDPRGRIYQTKDHVHLLGHTPACRGGSGISDHLA